MSMTSASRSLSISLGEPTMADVLTRIVADPEHTARRKSEIASAIRTLGKALQRPLAEIPGDSAKLARILDRFSPALAGIKDSRWRNVMSLLRSALGQTGTKQMQARSTGSLTPKWATLFEQVPQKRTRFGLSRFAHFCSEAGVEPEDVNDEVSSRYLAALEQGNLILQPRKNHRTAVTIWNAMASKVAIWPPQHLTIPNNSKNFVLPWSVFPPSLKQDVDAYLAHLAAPDILDVNHFRSLRPATVASRSKQVRGFISALVLKGLDPQSLCRLADVVRPELVEIGLRFLLGRTNCKRPPSVYQTLCALRAIAKYWAKLDVAQIKVLDRWCDKLKPASQGMTPTNRTRLRQFDDPEVLKKLLLLTETLMAPLAKIKQPSVADALIAQTAVCIEFLLMMPLRIKNLAGLDLKRHLPRTGRGIMHLDIPGDEVKTGQAIVSSVSPQLAKLIDLYVERYRPLLMSKPSPFLFPGATDGSKSICRLRTQIVECLKRHCGIEMHPHLFRHFAAKVYLTKNPGGYGVVRLVNGHSSINTTTKYYSGTEATAAVEHYDQNLLELRNSLRTAKPAPGFRKRRAA